MTLNSSMTNLASTIRDLTWGVSKFSVDDLTYRLKQNCLYNTRMPKVVAPNGNGLSNPDGNAQILSVNGSISGNFYLDNWTAIQYFLLKDKTYTVKQAMTVETDGKLNSIYLHTYMGSAGNLERNVVSKIAKLDDKTTRVSFQSLVDTSDKAFIVEPFNFDADFSSATYIKFSEPYLEITLGGGRIKLMLLHLQSSFKDWRYSV